eukprot:scaffold9359_cov49-Cyclotella_meneghiniana.AAC.3
MAVPPTTTSTPRSYRGFELFIKVCPYRPQTYRLKINYVAFVAASDDVKRVIKEDRLEGGDGFGD